MGESSPHIPLSIGIGGRGIILMVFEVVSVFFLRKPDQRKGRVIARGTMGVRAYAIQRLQTGIQNLLRGLSSSLVHKL